MKDAHGNMCELKVRYWRGLKGYNVENLRVVKKKKIIFFSPIIILNILVIYFWF